VGGRLEVVLGRNGTPASGRRARARIWTKLLAARRILAAITAVASTSRRKWPRKRAIQPGERESFGEVVFEHPVQIAPGLWQLGYFEDGDPVFAFEEDE